MTENCCIKNSKKETRFQGVNMCIQKVEFIWGKPYGAEQPVQHHVDGQLLIIIIFEMVLVKRHEAETKFNLVH